MVVGGRSIYRRKKSARMGGTALSSNSITVLVVTLAAASHTRTVFVAKATTQVN